MIAQKVKNIWKTTFRVSAMLEEEKGIILAGFKGEISWLEKSTGKVDICKEAEIQFNDQVIGIQKLSCLSKTLKDFLFQFKMGLFVIIRMQLQEDGVSWQLKASIKTSLVGLSQFPCHETSAGNYVIFGNELSEPNSLKTLKIVNQESSSYFIVDSSFSFILEEEQEVDNSGVLYCKQERLHPRETSGHWRGNFHSVIL